MSELEVLRCSGCGTPLALGDTEHIVCPSCGVLLGGAFAMGTYETPDHGATIRTIGIVALLALFVFFLIRSGGIDDAEERRASNDLPKWVGIVAPLVVAFLLFRFLSVLARF